MEPVAVEAIFSKATTLVDGAWRVSFDLGEHQGESVTQMHQMKDQPLMLVVMTQEQYERQSNEKGQR